jgi:hypothetical protein
MASSAATTNFQTAALLLLESATQNVTFESTGHTFAFVTPCSGLDRGEDNIIESASVLVASRVLSKLGRSGKLFHFSIGIKIFLRFSPLTSLHNIDLVYVRFGMVLSANSVCQPRR